MKKRFSEVQIIGFLRETEAGLSVKDLCRRRRALKLAGLSPSVLRYERRDDGNGELRSRIVALARRHRRHGYRMIHLRLRQEGWLVNMKRVRKLYRQENLMVHKRKRKKVARGCATNA